MSDEPERRRSQDAALDAVATLHAALRETGSQLRDISDRNEKLCEARHKLGVATLPAMLRWGLVASFGMWLVMAICGLWFAMWTTKKVTDLESMFIASAVSDVRTKAYSDTFKDIKQKIEEVEAEVPVDADPPSEEPASEVSIPPAPTPEE